jgi:excinuclease UvrABC nuclease subunit
MTKTEIQNYLQKLENKLLKEVPRLSINLNRNWANKFPNASAVYLFREGDDVVYVGETGSFKGRMNDILNTKNHTIRRNIGSLHFSNHKDFEKVTSKKSFHPEIEILLNEKMTNDLTISFIEIELGRKELEEQLYEKFSPKYSVKGKRGAIKSYTKHEKQEKNAQAYEPWTTEQDDQLEVLYSEGTKVKELAIILERSSGSIRSRIKKLELKEIYGF